MRRFYRVFGLVLVAGLCGGGAHASDLRRPAAAVIAPLASIIPWAGFYVGLNGGYGFSRDGQALAGANANGAAVIASGFVPGNLDTHAGGALFGAQAGYNVLFGSSFLAGVETDFDWSGIKGSAAQALSLPPLALVTSGSTKLAWLGTLRARGGYLVTPTTLIYATGGLAYGHANASTNVTLTAPVPFGATAAANSSAIKIGWTAGAGIEQMILQKWSVKAEYAYVDLGSIGNSFGATVGGTPVNFSSHQDLHYHTVKVGLNYHF